MESMLFLKYPPPTRKTRNMHILYILAVLTIETAVLCSCDVVKIKCTNADKFLYTNPATNCTKYYRCTDASGRAEVKECGLGSVFNFYTQTCSSLTGICVDPNCTGLASGVYPDTTHACLRSFTCHAGRVTSVDNSSPEQMHNGHQGMSQAPAPCIEPDRAGSMGYPFEGDQRCIGKANGYYGVTGNCSSYIVCFAEKVTALRNCFSGQRFHYEQGKCLPPEMVPNCGENDVTAYELESICKHQREGASADPTSVDCTTYITCKGGKFESRRHCSHQAVFNGWGCVPSPLYQCPSMSSSDRSAQLIDLCYKKANGFHASPQHGCSFYMRCISGRAVEVHECPTGQYFDAESKRCILEKSLERRRCLERGISFDCDGKSNGFFAEPNCLSYYHCYLGYKTEYKCSTNKVFNGISCVAKSQYICPTAGSDMFCLNRPDGYHKDNSDSCRSYHFCSTGHKITYLCDLGYMFDSKARKCVRQQLSDKGQRCRSDYMCYGKSDGYHADYRSNCRKYVYCKSYDKITQLTCRDNNVFNGQKCVHPSEYACPSLYNHRQLNCMPKHCIQQCQNDGFYPDLNTGCRDYFFCIGGKASKLSCPLGRRFNGEVCVSEDKFSCPELCNPNNEDVSLSSCPLNGLIA